MKRCALEDLVRQGKVLYVGVSQWSAKNIGDALEYQTAHDFDRLVSNQPYYNALGRDLELEVMPLCEREGIGQVVYSPLAQGVLTGKYQPNQAPPSDSRAADPKQNQFLPPEKLDQAQLQRVQNLKPLAEKLGLSLAQLALAWCLRKENVASVIIGASRPAQVDDNAAASDASVSVEDFAEMDSILVG